MKQYICDRCGKVLNIKNDDTSLNVATLYDKDAIAYMSRHELCDDCLRILDKLNSSFISYDKSNDSIETFLEFNL